MALKDLNNALFFYPKDRFSLELRQSVFIEQKRYADAIKDERKLVKDFPYSSGNGSFPKLSSLAKISLLENEPLICTSGQIFRENPEAVRHVFLQHNINPASLSVMRGIKRIPIKGYSIFQQLDSLDLKKREEMNSKYKP